MITQALFIQGYEIPTMKKRGDSVKLNTGDCIIYDDYIYTVVAVVWSTVYLQKLSNIGDYDYTMEQLYENGFRDIEIIKSMKEN